MRATLFTMLSTLRRWYADENSTIHTGKGRRFLPQQHIQTSPRERRRVTDVPSLAIQHEGSRTHPNAAEWSRAPFGAGNASSQPATASTFAAAPLSVTTSQLGMIKHFSLFNVIIITTGHKCLPQYPIIYSATHSWLLYFFSGNQQLPVKMYNFNRNF